MSSSHRGHANLLCVVPVLVYVLPKREHRSDLIVVFMGHSQVAQWLKNLPANAGDIRDTGLIPGSGRSPGRGRGPPLQYSGLENPVDRGAWQAAVTWGFF